jgi:hypothetical protein
VLRLQVDCFHFALPYVLLCVTHAFHGVKLSYLRS